MPFDFLSIHSPINYETYLMHMKHLNHSNPHPRCFKTAAVVAALALLAACGGGGDTDHQPGDGASVGGAAPPAGAGIEVGTPTAYEPGSIQALTLAYINGQLTQCGYAALRSVQDLTTAATAHANFIALNGDVVTHDEDPSAAGFTGRTHRERLRAAGASEARADGSSEGIGGTSVWNGQAINGLIAAPMHQADLLDGWPEVGVGTPGGQGPVNLAADARQIVLAYGGERQGAAPGEVRNYPCAGSVGVPAQGAETPNPLPELVGGFSGGLTFETSKAGALEVDSLVLVEDATGTPLRTVRVTGPAGYTLANSATWRTTYVAATVLKDGTAYRVSARGRVWDTSGKVGAGASWVKDYTFKTF